MSTKGLSMEPAGVFYVVAKIREALGVGGKPMLMDLPELVSNVVQDRDRYKAALKFYADSDAPRDMGAVARKALVGD